MIHRFRATALVGTGMMLGIVVSMAWSAYGSTAGATSTSSASVGGQVLSAQAAQGTGCQTFPQTGYQVCGRFLSYWQTHGGLIQQGYPISQEFVETSDLNGRPYTVQYFQRAVFEYHPENNPPYDVLLSQLGTFLGQQNYPQGFPHGIGALPFYEDRTDPVKALKSYYNAINRKEYDRAYSYFETPPNPFPQFVQGYANTGFVTLAVGKVETQGAAGSIYATFPVVLTATMNNGSKQLFSGCYTMRRNSAGISPDPNAVLWRIYSAKLNAVPVNSNIDQLLAQSCSQ